MTIRKLKQFQSVKSFSSDGLEVDIVDHFTVEGVYEPTKWEIRWSKLRASMTWAVVRRWDRLCQYCKRLGLALIGRDLESWDD